jgi:hypothetical protein
MKNDQQSQTPRVTACRIPSRKGRSKKGKRKCRNAVGEVYQEMPPPEDGGDLPEGGLIEGFEWVAAVPEDEEEEEEQLMLMAIDGGRVADE